MVTSTNKRLKIAANIKRNITQITIRSLRSLTIFIISFNKGPNDFSIKSLKISLTQRLAARIPKNHES